MKIKFFLQSGEGVWGLYLLSYKLIQLLDPTTNTVIRRNESCVVKPTVQGAPLIRLHVTWPFVKAADTSGHRHPAILESIRGVIIIIHTPHEPG